MGISKAGLLFSDEASIEEVFYCFDKAVIAEPDKREEVFEVVYNIVLQISNALAELYAAESSKEKEAQWQKTKGYIFGIASAFVGATSQKQNRFINLSALGGEVLGFASVVDAKSKLNQIQWSKERIISIIKDLKYGALNFFPKDSVENKKLEDSIDETIKLLINPVQQYLDGKPLTVEEAAITPEELSKLVEYKLKDYKQTKNTIGWILVIIGCFFFKMFLNSYNKSKSEGGNIDTDDLWMGIFLFIFSIRLFYLASQMTFEKMKEQVKSKVKVKPKETFTETSTPEPEKKVIPQPLPLTQKPNEITLNEHPATVEETTEKKENFKNKIIDTKYRYIIIALALIIIILGTLYLFQITKTSKNQDKQLNLLQITDTTHSYYQDKTLEPIVLKTDSSKLNIYPQASERLLTDSDITGLNKWQLKIMRNEIYARHGYIFQTEEMKSYFNKQKWYNPKYNDVSSFLSQIEKDNIEFIKKYE